MLKVKFWGKFKINVNSIPNKG